MHWMQHKKPQLSANYHFWKNQEKPTQNGQKWAKWSKMTILSWFFLIFSEMVLLRELRFFALHSVYQNPSFELSKSTFWQFFRFFILRGDPYDFGVVKSYPEWKKWLKKIPKKKIWKIRPRGTGKWVVEVSSSQVVLSGTLYSTGEEPLCLAHMSSSSSSLETHSSVGWPVLGEG